MSKKKWLSKYNIIVDEDVLKTMICNQGTIMLSDIEEIISENLPRKVYNKLLNLTEISKNKKYFSVDKIKLKKSIDAPFDIYALTKTTKFYSDGQKLVFYKTPKLKNVKYIIMSATVDKVIYESYFGKNRIKFYKCPLAAYTGSLKQYYDGSYSRNYIDKNDDTFGKIEAITGDIPRITFKKYHTGCDIHFGNSEGHNTLEGKDIAVIGTPHMNDCVYKLMSYHMDGNTDESSHFRPIEYNGFKFWFHTYEDELLRRIQLWLIESELEQCIGRARLLRNNCTVYLFSNFPLKQSELINSEP